MPEATVIGIRRTIIQLKPGEPFRRIKMTEQARQLLTALGTSETYNMIEIPCLHSETHRAFWYTRGWEAKKRGDFKTIKPIVYIAREDLRRWMAKESESEK